jgi:small subunit ribosomal protein S17
MAEETENTTPDSTEESPPVEEAATETPSEEAVAEATAPEQPSGPEAAPEPAVERTDAQPVAEAPQPAAEKKKRKRLPRMQRRQRPKAKRERPAERTPITRLPKPESERGRRQERRGVVVSNAMDKTIVVKVDTIKSHRRYKKVVRRSVKFHAHDEQNRANVGDVVLIVETRPLSKTKNWRLAEIVEAAR